MDGFMGDSESGSLSAQTVSRLGWLLLSGSVLAGVPPGGRPRPAVVVRVMVRMVLAVVVMSGLSEVVTVAMP